MQTKALCEQAQGECLPAGRQGLHMFLTVWQDPNQFFTNTAVKHKEYGISVNKKTFAELAEYAFEKQVLNY